MDWIVAIAAFFHLVASPYTKVEESFNIQACHDILYHGAYLLEYDHLEFPGVVPRTFIGPLLVSSISWPVVVLFQIIGLSKLLAQYVVRFVLGALVVLAWRHLRIQIQTSFGKSVAIWFTFITVSQFHFIFYLSRPLPNTFALIFALLSFSFWLQQHHRSLLISSGVGFFIFRSELCLLLGPMLLYDLASRKIELVKFLKYAIPIGLLCLFSTIMIDSLFWLRLVWPEGEVFWFNTYKNQSSNWGVYPFLWYWYSCLPRGLGFSIFLVPVGIAIDPRIRTLVSPGLLFVALYSFLPHKELRFIIYVFPLFNVAAARACQFFWTSRLKTPGRKLLAVISALHILGNLLVTSLFLTISSNNYPGGVAMSKFHKMVPPNSTVHLHIDNFAAQTGVTRFTELHWDWRYNKTENLKAGGKDIRGFTHLLVEAKSKYAYNLKHYTSSHKILGHVDSFSHLSFNYLSFPPVKIRVKPAIFILENEVHEDIDESLIPMEQTETESSLDSDVLQEDSSNASDSIQEQTSPLVDDSVKLNKKKKSKTKKKKEKEEDKEGKEEAENNEDDDDESSS